MKAIERAAYLASTELAAEKGAFPLFDARRFLAGENRCAGWTRTCRGDRQHGMRNGLLTSIAPTGTISIFADNVSSGLEPVFSFNYTATSCCPTAARQARRSATTPIACSAA
jgi:ribonucleoside-diphosphate reductase alpha chain